MPLASRRACLVCWTLCAGTAARMLPLLDAPRRVALLKFDSRRSGRRARYRVSRLLRSYQQMSYYAQPAATKDKNRPACRKVAKLEVKCAAE